ncbi:MAG: hypothetical protein AAFY88_27110, partial [Acidobacteriota bacterium]
GPTFAGTNRVQARLRNGTVDDEAPDLAAFAAFDIGGSSQLTAAVTTDVDAYPVGAEVPVFGAFSYLAGNQPLPSSELILTVLDAADAELTAWSQDLGLLLPGADGGLERRFASVGQVPGVYRARLELRQAGALAAQAETSFSLVDDAAQIAGAVTGPAPAPEVGEPLDVRFTVRQLSGAPAAEALVRLAVLRASDLAQVASRDVTVPLAVGDVTGGTAVASASSTASFDTTGYALGDHLVVLSGALQTPAPIYLELDRTTVQTVDRTPPAVTVVDPAPGGFLPLDSTALVEARDVLSPVSAVDLQVDAGPWTPAVGLLEDRFEGLLADLSEGPHTLRARAFDAAGNLGVSADVDFIVDRTPPEIVITGVVDGGSYPGSATPVIEIVELYPGFDAAQLNGLGFLSGTEVTLVADHELTVIA